MTTESVPEEAQGLAELLKHGGANGTAFIAPEDGRVLTYGQLSANVEASAGRLSRIGVRRGDRSALALTNSHEFIELVLAIGLLGAAAAPLNPGYTESEFSFYLDDIAPRLLLVAPNQSAAGRSAATTGTEVVTVTYADNAPPILSVDGAEVTQGASFEAGGPEDVAIVLHTSGTTSRPKQVPLLQKNLMASARTIAKHYQLTPTDVSLCVMPLFHVHGLIASAFASLDAGGAVVVPRRFTPQRFWSQARQWGATWLSAGPTLHQMILDKVDAVGAPETLRFTRSCSSALSAPVLARAEELYQVPMLEAYGMTEASHQMASNPLPPGQRIIGTVGVATGVEIAIVDNGLNFLPDGTLGEVVIRGSGVTPGYVNNANANAEAFFGDRWFRTGDLGALEGGYLRLGGRLKEIIIRGGENISPTEVEAVLLSHPAVREAVCFGVEDEKYGEQVSAAVTLKGAVDPQGLIDHCRGHLTAVKVPTTIHVLGEIPRTPTGKVQRRRMATLLSGSDGAG